MPALPTASPPWRRSGGWRRLRRAVLVGIVGAAATASVAMVPTPPPSPGGQPTPTPPAAVTLLADGPTSDVAGAPTPTLGPAPADRPAEAAAPLADTTPAPPMVAQPTAGMRYVPPAVGLAIEAGRPTPVPGAIGVATPTPAPLVPLPTGTIAYATVQTIFTARCTACHGNAAGLRLDEAARDRLVGVPSRQQPGLMLVNPGAPDLSYLWQKVALDRPPTGVRMPRNGDPLVPDELETIRRWILQGARP